MGGTAYRNPASVYTHCETAIEAELVDRNSSFSSAAGAKAQFSLSHLRPD